MPDYLTAAERHQYLEGGGSACPFCGDGHPRRLVGDARRDAQPGGRTTLSVPCYCGPCGREWLDRYRLEDVIPTGGETCPTT